MALSYPERLQALLNNQVALWDVLQHCERQGSLDSAIRHESPNDFHQFLSQHPGLRLIAFNGRKAEQSFQRLVLPTLGDKYRGDLLGLPSTSPANAALRAEERRLQWRTIRRFL